LQFLFSLVVGVLSGIGASWTNLDPLSVMPIQEGWKLLASSSHFMSLRSKPPVAGWFWKSVFRPVAGGSARKSASPRRPLAIFVASLQTALAGLVLAEYFLPRSKWLGAQVGLAT
jgi:hypothetical protein